MWLDKRRVVGGKTGKGSKERRSPSDLQRMREGGESGLKKNRNADDKNRDVPRGEGGETGSQKQKKEKSGDKMRRQ